jgi:hypothetical protein
LDPIGQICVQIVDFLRSQRRRVRSFQLRRRLNAARDSKTYDLALGRLRELGTIRVENETQARGRWVVLVKVPRKYARTRIEPKARPAPRYVGFKLHRRLTKRLAKQLPKWQARLIVSILLHLFDSLPLRWRALEREMKAETAECKETWQLLLHERCIEFYWDRKGKRRRLIGNLPWMSPETPAQTKALRVERVLRQPKGKRIRRMASETDIRSKQLEKIAKVLAVLRRR